MGVKIYCANPQCCKLLHEHPDMSLMDFLRSGIVLQQCPHCGSPTTKDHKHWTQTRTGWLDEHWDELFGGKS